MIRIIPLIIPEIFFIENNKPHNYLSTNPSLYLDDKNNATLLIRNVNYRKYRNKQFEVFGGISNSKYILGKGNIDDIDNINYSIIEYDYNNFKTYNSWWLGMEDIRFINNNTLLITIPELSKNGMPQLFLGKLENNKIIIKKALLSPLNENSEKNWLPFPEKFPNKVVYSISPLRILDIDTGLFCYSNNQDNIKKIKGFHGSSNGIEFVYNSKKYILFLIHFYSNKTIHKWLLISENYEKDNDIILSNDFYLFKHSYIEFICSLCNYNNNYLISVGVNDNSSYLIEIDKSFILDKIK
jgi:hypothetical protein